MTPQEAFETLRQFALGRCDDTDLVREAVGVAADHTVRLEQTLHLLRTQTKSALDDCPPNGDPLRQVWQHQR